MKFACLDFETANHRHTSICAAGLAVFDDGELIETRHWLVRPPKGSGWFLDKFIAIHGITHMDVQTAPEFPAIALELFAYLSAAEVVVAHNAEFDMGKLRATTAHYGLECPKFNYLCTLALSRRVWPELPNHQLDTVAAHIGHQFRHHHAQEDAEAAGWVLLAMITQSGINSTSILSLTEFSATPYRPHEYLSRETELRDPD